MVDIPLKVLVINYRKPSLLTLPAEDEFKDGGAL
jgi:hypothetical protein